MTVIDPASVGFLREVGVETFLSWTEGADLLFANREEAETLAETTDVAAQIQILGRRFSRVVVKLGPDGAAVGGRDGIRVQRPAPAVTVVDTSGAGDAFAAGFLAAELSGKSEADCLAAGIATGSRAVQTVGAQPAR
jgi:sugar/nucleoside kinase (ribokinase family)